MNEKLTIVIILTMGFGLASIFGYLAQRLKISPLIGYMLAGFVIGPYSPGIVADVHTSEQLAEIGVILMMFGVGLHFKWKDLVDVKNIAIPGAIGQTVIAATATFYALYAIGWSLSSSIVIGVSIGVASTVVLVRMLTEYRLINTPQGYVAIGWLIVEDFLTVAALILLPILAQDLEDGAISGDEILQITFWVVIKFVSLFLIMLTIGYHIAEKILIRIARTRSHELFTLSIFALIFLIATGSALVFGISIALGAFIAGMIVGQTEVRYQALTNALPVMETFVAFFFISVGMLFNPQAIVDNFPTFILLLFMILILKPLIAFIISVVLRHPIKTAVSVAIALAQIGEFSFILAEEALKYKLLPDEGFDIIVAAAITSIAINPALFSLNMKYFAYKDKHTPDIINQKQPDLDDQLPQAIVVGYGPIGKQAVLTLEHVGWNPIIIDRNIDSIMQLRLEKKNCVFGDASHPHILEQAHIDKVKFVVITTPEFSATQDAINAVRNIHPKVIVLARARYLSELSTLVHQDVRCICDEQEGAGAFEKSIVLLCDELG